MEDITHLKEESKELGETRLWPGARKLRAPGRAARRLFDENLAARLARRRMFELLIDERCRVPSCRGRGAGWLRMKGLGSWTTSIWAVPASGSADCVWAR